MAPASIQPRILWGKAITYLRENKNIALQMACGDIVDVEIKDLKFIAHTQEEYNYNVLSQDYAKREIEKAFRFLGYAYSFEVRLEEKDEDRMQVDIQKLKDMFIEVKITD